MSTYRTKQGDVLDAVLWRLTGSTGLLAATLRANPGLAALGPVLPGGVEIEIPVPAPAEPRQPVRLWGGG